MPRSTVRHRPDDSSRRADSFSSDWAVHERFSALRPARLLKNAAVLVVPHVDSIVAVGR